MYVFIYKYIYIHICTMTSLAACSRTNKMQKK